MRAYVEADGRRQPAGSAETEEAGRRADLLRILRNPDVDFSCRPGERKGD